MNYFCRHGQVPSACVECYREAEAPPSEINDKTGWVYDPGQALANLRRAEAAEKRVAELEAEAPRKPSADSERNRAVKIVIEEITSSTGPTGGWLDSPKAILAEIVARLEGANGRESRQHPEPAPQCLCTTEPANPAEDNFLPVRVTNKRCPEHGEHSEPAKGGGQ